VVAGATPLPNATMVQAYNSAIENAAKSFESTRGVKAMVFDTYSYFTTILDDPLPYGIYNTTGYCAQYDAPDIATNYASYGCLPLKEYFWYNTGHITSHVHELLAGGVADFLQKESR
jgi:phospholipase/lecithinase/hemolysin